MKHPDTKHTRLHTQSQRSVIVILQLVAIMVAVTHRAAQASDTGSGQWNIMVVPSREAVYSGQARQIFNQLCAKCHSKDGRAQTPIARQRHVQDLSESRLADDVIVEQVLEGTHNKANTFKMPPFKEKLSCAEVESLVPLIKAFRPVAPEQAEHVAASPRLAGIINFPNRKSAVLERVAHSGRYFILRMNESHDGIQLVKVMAEKGAVRLRLSGRNSLVTLQLAPELTPSSRAQSPGLLRRLFDSRSNDRHSLALDRANPDLILFLYAQFTGRTLLRSPHLPATALGLNATGTDQLQIARHLERALAEKGITAIPDGEKFLLVVPAADAAGIRPRSREIKSLAADNGKAELFPGGTIINLPNTELGQVARLYAALTGRALDKAQRLPSSKATVNFTTQTPLSVEEGAYAIETLLRWRGLKLVPLGSDLFTIDPALARQ